MQLKFKKRKKLLNLKSELFLKKLRPSEEKNGNLLFYFIKKRRRKESKKKKAIDL